MGNTPLIKLRKASEITQCNILGKAEFLNPGQSVKDRAALYIIKELEKEKNLDSKIIVEGTEGNTGIGLTIIGSAMGIKLLLLCQMIKVRKKLIY